MFERILLGLYCGGVIAIPGTLLAVQLAVGLDIPSLNAVFLSPDRVRDVCIALFVSGGVAGAFIRNPQLLWPLFLAVLAMVLASGFVLTLFINGLSAGRAVASIAVACALFSLISGYYAWRLWRRTGAG